RVEVGIIRAPGPEEAMQGYMAYNFNAYSAVTQQLMFQSFFNPSPAHKYVPFSGGYLVPVDNNKGTNAFRYSGIAAMDWFRHGNWEFTYDAMVGSFAPPTSVGSFGDAPIFAGRLQESYIIGGKGPFRGDVTGFAWYQYARPIFNDRLYNFHREGFGVAYMQGYMHKYGRWFKADYIQGSGLIEAPAAFGLSAETYAAPNLYQAQVYPGIGNHAYGYSIRAGFFVLPKLEIDERYDYYNRLPNNDVQNRVFSTWTTGVQYHVTPLMRLVLNYGVRDANAPHLSSIPAKTRPIAKSVTGSIDNIFTAQFVAAF
ncbi:MAG TPA: hypothetical protein VMV54_03170, partial [Acidocella sp.]|nr:hypothetical protein [Acidocella sp.]